MEGQIELKGEVLGSREDMTVSSKLQKTLVGVNGKEVKGGEGDRDEGGGVEKEGTIQVMREGSRGRVSIENEEVEGEITIESRHMPAELKFGRWNACSMMEERANELLAKMGMVMEAGECPSRLPAISHDDKFSRKHEVVNMRSQMSVDQCIRSHPG